MFWMDEYKHWFYLMNFNVFSLTHTVDVNSKHNLNINMCLLHKSYAPKLKILEFQGVNIFYKH